MGARGRFQGRRIDSTCLQWAFCSAKHGWKSFLTLNSFPAHIRDFKNLKSTWHQMLARSHQLQGIFGLLKPFIHVQILICFVDVYQNHGVIILSLSSSTQQRDSGPCHMTALSLLDTTFLYEIQQVTTHAQYATLSFRGRP